LDCGGPQGAALAVYRRWSTPCPARTKSSRINSQSGVCFTRFATAVQIAHFANSTFSAFWSAGAGSCRFHFKRAAARCNGSRLFAIRSESGSCVRSGLRYRSPRPWSAGAGSCRFHFKRAAARCNGSRLLAIRSESGSCVRSGLRYRSPNSPQSKRQVLGGSLFGLRRPPRRRFGCSSRLVVRRIFIDTLWPAR